MWGGIPPFHILWEAHRTGHDALQWGVTQVVAVHREARDPQLVA